MQGPSSHDARCTLLRSGRNNGTPLLNHDHGPWWNGTTRRQAGERGETGHGGVDANRYPVCAAPREKKKGIIDRRFQAFDFSLQACFFFLLHSWSLEAHTRYITHNRARLQDRRLLGLGLQPMNPKGHRGPT